MTSKRVSQQRRNPEHDVMRLLASERQSRALAVLTAGSTTMATR
jgi:hypothetical protein